MITRSNVGHFSSLEDPRTDRLKRHSLIDIIIIITIAAISSGADGWEAIEDFGKEKFN